MPSIDDVFKELQKINSNLITLHVDEGKLEAGVGKVEQAADGTRLAVLDGVVELKSIHQEAIAENDALIRLSQQTASVLCILEKISENTCRTANEAHLQSSLQRQMAASMAAQLEIQRTVHPKAALELARREAVLEEIRRCCPPEEERPICAYEPCDGPPALKSREVPR